MFLTKWKPFQKYFKGETTSEKSNIGNKSIRRIKLYKQITLTTISNKLDLFTKHVTPLASYRSSSRSSKFFLSLISFTDSPINFKLVLTMMKVWFEHVMSRILFAILRIKFNGTTEKYNRKHREYFTGQRNKRYKRKIRENDLEIK